MKAKEINGKIEIFNTLPSTWNGTKHYMGGFQNSSVEVLEEEGFFDIVNVNIDERIQERGDLYFENNQFHYTINEKTWSETLEELKNKKLEDLKYYTRGLLNETDWYYTRKLERDIDIPQDIIDERNLILEQHEVKKNEINALNTKADIIIYEFK